MMAVRFSNLHQIIYILQFLFRLFFFFLEQAFSVIVAQKIVRKVVFFIADRKFHLLIKYLLEVSKAIIAY